MGRPRQTHCHRGHELSPQNRSKGIGRCKLCVSQEAYEEGLRRKREVLTHYGKNGTLQCCWEDCEVTDLDMLSLDHINNDGAEHRRAYNGQGGERVYVLLKRQGYPPICQTLCWNHQWKKEMQRRRGIRAL